MPVLNTIKAQRIRAVILALAQHPGAHDAANSRINLTNIDTQAAAFDDVAAQQYAFVWNLLWNCPGIDSDDPKTACEAARKVLTDPLANAPAWKFFDVQQQSLDQDARKLFVDAVLPSLDFSKALPVSLRSKGFDEATARATPHAAAAFEAIQAVCAQNSIPLPQANQETLIQTLASINYSDPSSSNAVVAAINAAFNTTPANQTLFTNLLLLNPPAAAVQTAPQKATTRPPAPVVAAGAAQPACDFSPAAKAFQTRCEHVQIACAIIEKLQLIAVQEGYEPLSVDLMNRLRAALLQGDTLDHQNAICTAIKETLGTHPLHHLITITNAAIDRDHSPLFNNEGYLNLDPTSNDPIAAPILAHFIEPKATPENMAFALSLEQCLKKFAALHNLPGAILNDKDGWLRFVKTLARYSQTLSTMTDEALWKLIFENLPQAEQLPISGMHYWSAIENHLRGELGLLAAQAGGQTPYAAAIAAANGTAQTFFSTKALDLRAEMADEIVTTCRAYAKANNIPEKGEFSEKEWDELRHALATSSITAGHTLLDCTAAELQQFLTEHLPGRDAVNGTNPAWGRTAVNALGHLTDNAAHLFAQLKIDNTAAIVPITGFNTMQQQARLDLLKKARLDYEIQQEFIRWAQAALVSKTIPATHPAATQSQANNLDSDEKIRDLCNADLPYQAIVDRILANTKGGNAPASTRAGTLDAAFTSQTQQPSIPDKEKALQHIRGEADEAEYRKHKKEAQENKKTGKTPSAILVEETDTGLFYSKSQHTVVQHSTRKTAITSTDPREEMRVVREELNDLKSRGTTCIDLMPNMNRFSQLDDANPEKQKEFLRICKVARRVLLQGLTLSFETQRALKNMDNANFIGAFSDRYVQQGDPNGAGLSNAYDAIVQFSKTKRGNPLFQHHGGRQAQLQVGGGQPPPEEPAPTVIGRRLR